MPSFNEFNEMHRAVKGWVDAHVPTRTRRGAVGKALIVYLASGSIGLAIVAYLLFRGMGC